MSKANNSFIGIVNQADQLSNLSVSSLIAVNASFSSVDGKLTEGTVVGYTPVAFGIASIGLSTTPNSVAVTALNAVTIPVGAIVTQVSVIKYNKYGDVTDVDGGTFDIGVGAYGSVLSTLFNSVTAASVNTGAFTIPATATGIGTVSPNNFITVKAVAAVTTGNGFKVTVSYLLV